MAWLGAARQIAWAWLDSANRFGLARLEALLHGTLPIVVSMFRAPVLATHTRLAWAGLLGLGFGWAWVKLSPVDKFDKLKSGVIAPVG